MPAISSYTEATTAAAADETLIVQGGATKRIGIDTIFSAANSEWTGWIMLTTPLTSTSWDGDAYSTTAKTLIDLSTVFGVPAGVKAVNVRCWCRDSASAAATVAGVLLAPNNTANQAAVAAYCQGIPNDIYFGISGIVPCDANGDIYYQIIASGASTLDVYLEVWSYLNT